MATPQTRLREFLPDARELAVLLAARGLACVAAFGSGFRALSDDDYARISIAQRFAHGPSLDPSGTSWLPAPFWLYGAAFRGFGTGLCAARVTAIALGLGATALVYVAARVLGTNRISAMLAALLSCLALRYSTLLGIAALPEVPCAALLLLASATLARPGPALRGWGGLCLLAACLARYEAWPVAAVFAACCAWDARKPGGFTYLASALLALAGPAAWLALGRAEHGDALFFVARVTEYRRALGGNQASTLQRLLVYPELLCSGGFSVGAVLIVTALSGRGQPGSVKLRYGRPALALLGMLAFLMLGSVRDGVPTHHAARVLLPLWFFGCVIAGAGLPAVRTGFRPFLAVISAMPVALLLFWPNDDFAYRSLELEAGQAARLRAARRLAIDTPDYGFFAVQAGFGSPDRTSVLDEHDPRHPRATAPFESAQAVERALRASGADFVIVTPQHAALLRPPCADVWNNAGFVLFRCAPPP